MTFLQGTDKSPFSSSASLCVERFHLVRLDTSHQPLLTPNQANLVDTNTAPLLFMLLTVQSRCCITAKAPQKKERRLIQAYHTLCLSACQMHCMCPSSHLVCLTNFSCLSIHPLRCHSICLALGLFCLKFLCVYFSDYITRVTITLPGDFECFFLTRFVMLILSVGIWLHEQRVRATVCMCLPGTGTGAA